MGRSATGLVLLAIGAAVFDCSNDTNLNASNTTKLDNQAVQAQATEWVGFHTEVPFAVDDLHPLFAGLFGDAAQRGQYVTDRVITPGVFVTSAADSSTPDQAVVTFSFDDGTAQRKKLAIAPTSFAIGSLFEATIDTALAKMKGDEADKAGSGESFYLEYRVNSANGGRLSIGVRAGAGKYALVVDIATRRTSLEAGQIGKAAESTAPYDTVAGTVWFHMSKDDFDYFSDHAYGKGATSKQNFTDFALVPHNWLRLNVEPHLDDKFVNVGFEVIGVDGKRIALAKAPASILAGKVFQSMVDRNMTNMLVQERDKPGSSTAWQVPFYYDAPGTGGVVQVIAEGSKGIFDVAYAVESPRHALKDVPFLAYDPVEIPKDDPLAKATCDKLGDPNIVIADKGTLNLKFTASDVVKHSADLSGPLMGNIYCSVYAAADVQVDGPKKDAFSIQDFVVQNADMTGATPPTFVTQALHAGSYQVLCALDLDKDGNPSPGDPVTLPIGSYPVACNQNPATIEFALLYPKDR